MLWPGSCSLSRAQDAMRPTASPTSVAASVAGDDPAQYQGQYRDVSNPDQVHAVYLEDGVLYEESEHRERQRLTPDAFVTADHCRIESPAARVVFLRDDSGAISGLKIVLDRDGGT